IRFGPAFRLEDLGAYASEAPVPSGGFVRLISPAWADAPSAAWRAAGFGRWIGVVLETDDLAATAAFFAAGKIPYREADRGGPGPRVKSSRTPPRAGDPARDRR